LAPGPHKKPYLILSLDGGGIRGVLTAGIIEQLEAKCAFLSEVQLVAGTSTGGILALGLASGMNPTEVKQLYIRTGEKIFKKRRIDEFFDRLLKLDVTIFRAKYNNQALREELAAELTTRAARLDELQKRVLISTFNLCDENRKVWKPKFFNNYPGDKDCQENPIEVALRTSAAPTYFPSFGSYVDGGVIANNPSMCAVAQALNSVSFDSPTGPESDPLDCDDIFLLSIGTGENPKKIEGSDLNWGFGKWWKPLYDVLMDGSVGVADYQARQLLGPRYARINFPFPRNREINLDDVSSIPELSSWAADTQLDDALNVLDLYFKRKNVVSKGEAAAPTIQAEPVTA
jgi:uncharacterized protein